MIRFCDIETYIVQYEELDKENILRYFENGNQNNLVCVYKD